MKRPSLRPSALALISLLAAAPLPAAAAHGAGAAIHVPREAAPSTRPAVDRESADSERAAGETDERPAAPGSVSRQRL